jgi:hypothetical protein
MEKLIRFILSKLSTDTVDKISVLAAFEYQDRNRENLGEYFSSPDDDTDHWDNNDVGGSF